MKAPCLTVAVFVKDDEALLFAVRDVDIGEQEEGEEEEALLVEVVAEVTAFAVPALLSASCLGNLDADIIDNSDGLHSIFDLLVIFAGL